MQLTSNIRFRLILLFILILVSGTLSGQNRTRIGVMPALNYNKKLEKGWEWNAKWESRHMLYDKTAGQLADKGYNYSLSDVSFLVGKRVGLTSKLVGGLQTRIEPDESLAYKTMQHFTFITNYDGLRLGHRLTAEQSFFDNEPNAYGFRYRVVSEIPLNGEEVDIQEFYLKIGNEYVNTFQDSDYDLEVRIVPVIGYVLPNKHKVELGFNNRFDSFVGNDSMRFTSWFVLNWYIR